MRASVYIFNEKVQGCVILFKHVMRCFEIRAFLLIRKEYVWIHTVWCARTNNAIMNECYNEQFLSIKSGCCNEKRCYKERRYIYLLWNVRL